MAVPPVLAYCQINKLQKGGPAWGFEKVGRIAAIGGIPHAYNYFLRHVRYRKWAFAAS
jgi:hypothetical protein